MENASEPEAPRMSIQTKDLIRYTNHTIHQKKNHAKPIQKFHHNSTHSQSTTKRLDTLPADSEAPRHTPSRQRSASAHPPSHQTTRKLSLSVQRSADGSSNSLKSTQPHTINQAPEQPPYPSRPEKPAREACTACRRGFVGGWLLGCRESAKSVFQKSELASLKQRTFEKQRRFPPAKNQHLSCRVRRQAAHASRAGFSGREGRVAAR